MSCNGCRVLRKGCSGEECLLRNCLQWIDNPQAQGHATLFVAKFFGRATLMSFLSSVPTNQTPGICGIYVYFVLICSNSKWDACMHMDAGLFRSLLYEAVGRVVNPVTGAVGLLWTGNWHLCQLGVDQVLRSGAAAFTPPPQLPSLEAAATSSCHQQPPQIPSHQSTFPATSTNPFTLFFWTTNMIWSEPVHGRRRLIQEM